MPDHTESTLTEHMTPTQAKIFSKLKHGHTVSSDDLVDHIYGHRPDGGPLCAKRVIYTQMRSLRQRLHGTGYAVKTMGWNGYKMEANHA